MNRTEIQRSAGNIDGLKYRGKAPSTPVMAACHACGKAFEARVACGLSEVGDVEAYGVAFIEAALGQPSRYEAPSMAHVSEDYINRKYRGTSR